MDVSTLRKDDWLSRTYYDDSGNCKYVFMIDNLDEPCLCITTESYYDEENCISDQGPTLIKVVNKDEEGFGGYSIYDGTGEKLMDEISEVLGVEESSESVFTRQDGESFTIEDLLKIREYLLQHPRFSREIEDYFVL